MILRIILPSGKLNGAFYRQLLWEKGLGKWASSANSTMTAASATSFKGPPPSRIYSK